MGEEVRADLEPMSCVSVKGGSKWIGASTDEGSNVSSLELSPGTAAKPTTCRGVGKDLKMHRTSRRDLSRNSAYQITLGS